MQLIVRRIWDSIKNNKKIIENYFFMTLILILNSLFALLIYPYLIRTLGKESYGIYIFGTSIANYFICFIGFGFELYGVREIAKNPSSKSNISKVISIVFTAKLYLELFSLLIFIVLLYTIPILQENQKVYWICFSTTLVNILFPTWYFQGIQKMRVVTYIQLVFKLLSLPFIFYFVRSSQDIVSFSLIMSISTLLGSLYAFTHLFWIEKLTLNIYGFKQVWLYIKESQYFFYANFLNIIKTQSLNLIVGTRFGMADLAIFDLASKIVQIPMILLTSINGALFPKVMASFSIKSLKRILYIEQLIGAIAVLSVITLGKFAVDILGGDSMIFAYPIAIILSLTIWAFLQTGCYCSLILVPKKLDHYILQNLGIATLSLILYMFIGLSFTNNILVLPISLVLSAFTEVLYLWLVIKKRKLLVDENI